ncbi:MAG: AraC family transcriptional regulator [Chloroflexota bacterium]|nr:AraC family transcriptional regulator [Chloroflexota bacterium]
MDALGPVLNVLRFRATTSYQTQLRGDDGLALSATKRAGFHLVEEGALWLRTPETLIQAKQGDLVIVSDVAEYELLAHPNAVAQSLQAHRRAWEDESTKATAKLICGQFQAEHRAIYPLFSLLPPLIHIPSADGQAVEWLAAPLHFISVEMNQPHPGQEAVVSRLMEILFIMVLRHWIITHRGDSGGWAAALYHPVVGEVLALMHRHPEYDWTVESLAERVALSRSALATQFSELVGISPMQYLSKWRMQIAANWLMDARTLSLEAIAAHVGYTSPFAFSRAFKRHVGVSPANYRSGYASPMSEPINE